MADAPLYTITDLLHTPGRSDDSFSDHFDPFPEEIYPVSDDTKDANPFEPPAFSNGPSRPRRHELISKFFPEIRQQILAPEREATVRLSLLASEAILKDFIDQYDKWRRDLDDEPGVLVVHLAGTVTPDQCAIYYGKSHIEADIWEARKRGDQSFSDFLRGLEQAMDRYDSGDYALVAITDFSTAQLFPIRRDHPAKALADALNAHAAH